MAPSHRAARRKGFFAGQRTWHGFRILAMVDIGAFVSQVLIIRGQLSGIH